MRIKRFNVRYTEYIPEELQEGVIYISMENATASHMCACGCREEVVTPFTPNDWKLIYDGESVSLSPSIGNWSFPCRAHYFIQNNKVLWAKDTSKETIEFAHRQSKITKRIHYTKEDAFVVNLNSSSGQSRNSNSAPRNNKFLAALSRFFGFKQTD